MLLAARRVLVDTLEACLVAARERRRRSRELGPKDDDMIP